MGTTAATKTFKNTAAGKYDGETTLVMFARGASAPAGAWLECDELELDLAAHVSPLWTQNGVQYFGRL
jgi:hypothetical protein